MTSLGNRLLQAPFYPQIATKASAVDSHQGQSSISLHSPQWLDAELNSKDSRPLALVFSHRHSALLTQLKLFHFRGAQPRPESPPVHQLWSLSVWLHRSFLALQLAFFGSGEA